MQSRRYKKRFATGVSLCLWTLCSPAQAIDRTLWFHEGLAQTFEPSSLSERRFQAVISGNSYRDAFSLRTAAQIEVGPVEMGIQATRLFSLGIGADSANLHSAVAPLETVLGFEIARHYQSESGYFGRLGVAYLHALPSRAVGLKFQIDTGLVPTQRLPWSFRLRLALLVPTAGGDLMFNSRIETLHSVTPEEKAGFEWGGALGLGYRIYATALPLGRFEKFVFTLGPVARWRTGELGVITASAIWRIWLDEEQIPATLTTNVRTAPSEASGLPDFQVAWALPF